MSPELWQQVRERAEGRCEYCRLPDRIELTGPFHLEHVVARQHRGTDDLSNLAWACSRCNRHRERTSPLWTQTAEISLFNPRQEKWENHFEIVGAMICGTSPIGRATAALRRDVPISVVLWVREDHS